jgi:hypothetical protein
MRALLFCSLLAPTQLASSLGTKRHIADARTQATPSLHHSVAANATCNSTFEPGFSRRDDCADKVFNNVPTPEACAAQCCALAPAEPPPFPDQGCLAWSLNNWQQCFLCFGTNHPDGPPPASPANCSGGPSNCSTGVVTPPPSPPMPPPPATGRLGGEAAVEYTNYARLMRWPAYPNGTGQLNFTAGELSPEGWPNRDCAVVIFDLRPCGAWAPPIDDPEARQANLSGTWTVRLSGQANVSLSATSGSGMSLLPDVVYDAATNTQSQSLVVEDGGYPAVQNLLVLNFSATRLNASAPEGSGFRNLQVLKPGFGASSYTAPSSASSSAAAAAAWASYSTLANASSAAASPPSQSPPLMPLFTPNWARAHKMFDHLRWMGSTGTNNYGWRCGGDNPAGCSVVRWEDRSLPSYAFVDPNFCAGCHGTPWEHVVLAANELNTDVWINVPLTASAPTVCRTAAGGDPRECLDTDPTATYEYQLAKLFRDGNEYTGNAGLNPGSVRLRACVRACVRSSACVQAWVSRVRVVVV